MDSEGVKALAAKAGLVWITGADLAARPLWFSWHQSAVHVVVGGPEQPDPFGPDGSEVTVSLPSKDTRATAGRAKAEVVELHPGTAAWQSAAASLSGKRLNTTVDDLIDAWATRSRIIRLELRSVEPQVVGDPDGGVLSVDVSAVRPRRWRPMRGHARAASARPRKPPG